MRVRLTVARNGLPRTKVLWEVNPDSITISELLKDVDQTFPLGTDGSQRYDYIVEVNGYECLHYDDPHSILRDYDEVNIRPLQISEVQARSISGRCQITTDRIHVHDGIIFGRSKLARTSSRPTLRAPPLKRRRISCAHSDGQCPFETLVGKKDSHLEIGAGLDGAEDNDAGNTNVSASTNESLRLDVARRDVFCPTIFDSPMQDENDHGQDRRSTYGPENEETGASGGGIGSKLADRNADVESDASSSLLSEDSSSKSDSDSDSHSDSESDSETGNESGSGGKVKPTDNESVLVSKFSLSTPSFQSPSTARSKQASQGSGPNVGHGQGSKSTKARNQRRAELKKLRHLKSTKQIGPTCTLTQYKASLRGATFPKKILENLLDPVTQGGVEREVGLEATINTEIGPQAQPPLGVSKAITNSGPDNPDVNESLMSSLTTYASPKHDAFSPREIPSVEGQLPPHDSNDQQFHASITPDSTQKMPGRTRLDINSTNRMIYSSLGVRVPKTGAEQEQLRTKFATKATKPLPTVFTAQSPPIVDTSALENQDDWMRKIKLSAVECTDSSIILSTPPFPFQQRWDPQQRLEPCPARTGKGKKRKRNNAMYYGLDNHDQKVVKESDHSEDVGLNYDDIVEDSQAPTRSSHDHIEDENEDEDEEPDLPCLPQDHSSLSDLQPGDVKPTAIIAFKQLEVSEATNWSPTISPFRTAVVERFEDGQTLHVRLAKRDRPEHNWKYDDDGNRVYGKFEVMLGAEDEDDGRYEDGESGWTGRVETDGYSEISFADLVEAKLVRAALA